jgi:hypothetical protein
VTCNLFPCKFPLPWFLPIIHQFVSSFPFFCKLWLLKAPLSREEEEEEDDDGKMMVTVCFRIRVRLGDGGGAAGFRWCGGLERE